MKHKHCELIKAWADGATIQYFNDGDWHDCVWNTPGWGDGERYRIKPEPKPDVVRYICADKTATLDFHTDELHQKNLRLTFDGETGKLKAAEVL